MTQTPPPPSGQHDPQQRGDIPPDPSPQGYRQQPPPQGYQQGYGQQQPQGDEKTMMLLAHLSAPISMLLSVGWVPFLGPLLIWLFYKDKSHAVRTASAGAFNFNLSLTIASVVTWISVIITLGIGFLWAIPVWIVLFVVQLWCHIKGAIKASNGEVYDYPFQIRLLS